MSAAQAKTSASRLKASFGGGLVRPAPPLDEPEAAPRLAEPAPAAASRPPRNVSRIKQTVELPEDVYESLQDYARARRTSFQVLARALIDDLLMAGDPAQQARVDALVAAAEQAKRARRRGRADTSPAASADLP